MGNSTERPDPLFFHSPLKSEDSPWADPSRFQAAIHHQHFKLLTLDTGASWQLFDLREDPAESTDLASQFPDLVASLLDQYARWREACQASENGQDY
jgi:hypothetical protein